MAPSFKNPRSPTSPRNSASRPPPRAIFTMSSSSARVPPAWHALSIAAPKACARFLSSVKPPVAEPAPSPRIKTYLGFPAGLSGADLARRGVTQVKRFGTEVLAPVQAEALCVQGEYRVVKLSTGQELLGHSVVIASGVQWRRLDIPGMDRLTGAGIYYGAANTEASSYKDEDVYIIGGANSAGQAAVHFSQYARSVNMLVRADSLSRSMSHYLVERIQTIPNIKVEPHSELVEVHGQDS